MMEQLEESILDLFETILVSKFPHCYISEDGKSLNKFLIQSSKKSALRIEQFVDGEKQTSFGDFFGLQIHKTNFQRYHIDLYVKKSFHCGEKDITRIPNFSQEKGTLMEVVELIEDLFVVQEYSRSVQMKLRMLK